jgi:pilus assembly protein Flp/PilA
MQILMNGLPKLTRTRQRGQGMIEYALIVGLISIAAIAIITLIGPQLVALFTDVLEGLGGTAPTP